MALPVVKDVLECANFSSTVEPYIHQLQTLPYVLAESVASPATLKQIYLNTNPLLFSLSLAIALAPIFLVISEVNKNYSQVDRAWSIVPIIYNAHYSLYAHMAGLDTKRVDALAITTTIWGIRLTYNYYRKGGYSIGSEDYRWSIVKEKVGRTAFFLLNVTFISLGQSILLLMVTTPAYILLLASRLASTSPPPPSWGLPDTIAISVMLAFIAISWVADQQQWNYQQAKAQYHKTAQVPAGFVQEDLDRGFLTKGLFAYSRHPNFASEQGVWLTLYLWSCAVVGTGYNWSGVGAGAYVLLFQTSTWLTELLSSDKYPEYKMYQKKVGKFLPKLGAGPVTFSDFQQGGGVPKARHSAKARQRYNTT